MVSLAGCGAVFVGRVATDRIAATGATVTANRERIPGVGAANRAEPPAAAANRKQVEARDQNREQCESLRHDCQHSRKGTQESGGCSIKDATVLDKTAFHDLSISLEVDEAVRISRANEINRSVDLIYGIRKVGLLCRIGPIGRFTNQQLEKLHHQKRDQRDC